MSLDMSLDKYTYNARDPLSVLGVCVLIIFIPKIPKRANQDFLEVKKKKSWFNSEKKKEMVAFALSIAHILKEQ